MQLKGRVYEVVDWVYLAQNRVQWLALVTLVINLRSLQNSETVSCIK
jgi:hypothetical protein